jgi:hypothetical protein
MQSTPQSWVVYLMTIDNQAESRMAVCEQSEWEAMELQRPGYRKLVYAGIASETEAELIARDTSGDPAPRATRVQ